MKYRILICLALAAAAIACTKQPEQQLIDMPEFGPNPVPSPEDGYSYVTLSIPASEDLLWKDGDCISVEGASATETYTLVPGSTAIKGIFRGNAVTGPSFNIMVPGPQKSFAVLNNKDYSAQTQKANNDDSHIAILYALKGVNTLSGATLSQEWASANGGQFLKTGRMNMEIQVPSAINKVSSLTVSSSVAAFGTYTLTLPELNMTEAGHYIKAFLNLPWSIPAPAAGDVITITLNGDKTATKSTTLVAENTGASVSISLNGKEWTGEGLVLSGSGTAQSPYLIASADDLFSMKDLLEENAQSPVYFRLTADIDMKEMAWTPLVTEDKSFPIDFDGGGHTISNLTVSGEVAYPSFAGVVTGSIHDITFKDAAITGSATTASGIVAGQGAKVTLKNCHATGTISSAVTLTGGILGCIALADNGSLIENCSFKGSIDLPAAGDYNGGIVGAIRKGATNITISGCKVEADITSGTSKGNIGGILGVNWNGNSNVTIEKCSYKGTIKTVATGNGGSILGGICGYTQAITIRNCLSEGTITQCNYAIGGIAGCTFENCTIENCISFMTLYSRHGTGGIAGRGDNNDNTSNASSGYNDVFRKCIAWNPSIKSRLNITASNHSSGAVIGRAASKNVHQGCIRRPDMEFDCFSDAQYDVLFDQPDNDANGSLYLPSSLGQHYWPYHGTAAAAGKTASDVARDLGWDTSIWDLSGSTPVLK